MLRKMVLGAAAVVVALALGTGAQADSWKHQSGYGRHGAAWTGHGSHGGHDRGHWDGRYGHGYGHGHGHAHPYDRYYGLRPYGGHYGPVYIAPGGCVHPPHGHGWGVQIQIGPRGYAW